MPKLITGAHTIIYTRKPEADRAFLRDVFGLPHVDAGDGWLIFGLPPAELAVHPAARNNVHELYFICKDIRTFMAAMKAKGIPCGPIQQQRWGMLTHMRLPGGGKLGVYEPHHPRPKTPRKHAAARQSRRSD